MRHKGYTGILEVDDESGLIFGRVAGIRDVVTFQGETVAAARRSFEESVDFYIDICRQQGDEPQEPFSGRILVRVDPELHRALAVAADARRIELDALVEQTLSAAFAERRVESGSAAPAKAKSRKSAKPVPHPAAATRPGAKQGSPARASR